MTPQPVSRIGRLLLLNGAHREPLDTGLERAEYLLDDQGNRVRWRCWSRAAAGRWRPGPWLDETPRQPAERGGAA